MKSSRRKAVRVVGGYFAVKYLVYAIAIIGILVLTLLNGGTAP